jgi:hypothetical protein
MPHEQGFSAPYDVSIIAPYKGEVTDRCTVNGNAFFPQKGIFWIRKTYILYMYHQKVLLMSFPMNGHASIYRQLQIFWAISVSCPWWQKSPSVLKELKDSHRFYEQSVPWRQHKSCENAPTSAPRAMSTSVLIKNSMHDKMIIFSVIHIFIPWISLPINNHNTWQSGYDCSKSALSTMFAELLCICGINCE